MENQSSGSEIHKFETRNYKNWILAYRDWALPRTDAPESFIFWSAIFTIAAALRREVWISKKILGSWECFPHLYLMFVGPPGMRKTTAMMNFAAPLLKATGVLHDGPTFFTKESLLAKLIASPNSALYLTVGEFAELVQKNKPGELYDFLTSMYDSRDTLEIGTMMRGIETAIRPCLNLFSATTPAWIAANMSAAVIGGGLTSRFIFVYEDQLRDPQLVYETLMRDFGEDDMSNKLLEDLIQITTLAGEFSLAEGVGDYLNNWVKVHAGDKIKDPKLAGYHSRKPMMMLKLAMIISAATKDDLILTKSDIDFGIYALKTTEPSLPKVFGGIGKNEYSFSMAEIIGYVIQEGKASHDQILSVFRSAADPRKLQELIQGCVAMAELKAVVDGGKIMYYPT